MKLKSEIKLKISNEEAIALAKDIIDKLEAAPTLPELKEIYHQYCCAEWYEEYRKDSMKYPALNFSIRQDEIQALLNDGIINHEGDYYTIDMNKASHPLIRLLYATLFKRGELLKISPIIKGILSKENVGDIENAQILFQFGKYLSKPHHEPIIDQHVLRVFAIYDEREDERRVETIRKFRYQSLLTIWADSYRKWVIKVKSKFSPEEQKEAKDIIDDLLFALGKALKAYSL